MVLQRRQGVPASPSHDEPAYCPLTEERGRSSAHRDAARTVGESMVPCPDTAKSRVGTEATASGSLAPEFLSYGVPEMPSNIRLKLLVAAIGMACASAAVAANSEHVNVQNLGSVPAGSLAAHLNLGANMSLSARSTAHLPNGKQVVRQQQLYRGVPVYGRSVAVVQDAHGNVLRARGEVMKLPANLAAPLSVTPKLSAAQAIAKLQAHAHTTLQAGAAISNKKADLFVYPQQNGSPRLVYRTSYFVGGNHPSRPTAIVDAHTGEVIKSWEGLPDATANGPGGNQKTGEYYYGTDYAALQVTQSGSTCYLQNTNVVTYNLNHGTSGGTLVSFTCPTSNTDPTNGAYSTVNDAPHI